MKITHFLFVLAFGLGFGFMQFINPQTLQASLLNEYDDMTVEEALLQYHLKANDIVNEYVSDLVNEENVDVTYPSKKKGCTEDNRSTYCLSQALSDELFLLELSLAGRTNELDELEFTETTTLNEALDAAGSQQNTIGDELENARKTLDAVLVAYNEAQQVYPIHEELMSFFEELEKYTNGLAEVRSSVEVLPARFHNASTIECQ